MPCRDAAERLRVAPMPTGTLAIGRDARIVLVAATATHAAIVGLDSIGGVRDDDRGAVLVIGSHGALHGGLASSALPVDAAGAFFNDAGGGRDGAGYTRLPALDARGIAAATVAHTSARIGDARSMWATGTLSRVNRAAEARGLSTGIRVADAARALSRPAASLRGGER
jgi:hypothetical protein